MPLPGSGLLHPNFHQAVQGSAVGDLGMPDECTIRHPGTGEGSSDDQGNWTPPAGDTIYGPDGPCRAQARSTDDQVVVVGEMVVTLHRYYVGVPAAVDQVLVDDIVTITASQDPHLAGRHLIVRSVHFDTFLPRRLLICDDHPDLATEEVTP